MDIYQEEFLDSYKNPAHKGDLEDFDYAISKKNPYCGDVVSLKLKVENGVIKSAKFLGEMCSVSTVASERLCDFVTGKKVEDARRLSKEKILDLVGIDLSTSRVKCATLILDALCGALEAYE